jgi:hypothetical protein
MKERGGGLLAPQNFVFVSKGEQIAFQFRNTTLRMLEKARERERERERKKERERERERGRERGREREVKIAINNCRNRNGKVRNQPLTI